jgi:hypothetical protein
MAQDLTPWVEHLSGLIFLADPAWHRPSGKQADMADTFRRLGRAYQAAALARRAGEALNGLKSCLTIER